MNTPFKNVGIIGRVRNLGVKDTLKSLVDFLQKEQVNVFIEYETADSITEKNLTPLPRAQLGSSCDLLIVVGGDGSLLHAAHAAVDQNLPVLGINRGSLGFLTDILPSDLEKIHSILAGHYFIERRFLLSTSISLHEKNIGNDDALNEVALIPDAVPHMIEFEIYIDDKFVCSQVSDGLIIATPTGSTAYALSGGGPILHPQLDAIVLVPMFPHSLNNRPIVVEGNRKIRLEISPDIISSPRLSCDGRAYLKTPAGSQITIMKKNNSLQLVHPLDYDYYESLRSKLHWGKKLQYTE